MKWMMNKKDRMLRLNFKMKKLKFLIFTFLVSICFVLNVKAINADEIKVYDITLDVNESGLIHVNQKLQVDFSGQRHGIYANIPQRYQMNFDGRNKMYFFPVSNVTVKDFKYEVNKGFDGVSIKIGDANKYVSGLVNYEYSYDIQMRDLGLDGQQMLYFNLVGDKWELPINQVNFKIKMPKSFDQKPMFYSATSGKVDYSVTDKVITGQYQEQINYGQALTVKLDLDDNYFSFAENNNSQIIMLLVSVGITAVLLVLFFRCGRDDRVIKTVEFKAPDNMSSAQVGYVVDGKLQNKDVTSLFIYWAAKGYLSIREEKSKVFEFKKENDINSSELEIEKSIFNALFKDSDTVMSDDLPTEYFDIIIDIKSDYQDYYKKGNAIYEENSLFVKELGGGVVYLFIAINIAFNTWHFFGMLSSFFIAGGISLILFLITGLQFYSALTNRKAKSRKSNFVITFVAILFLIIYAVLYLGWSSIIGSNMLITIIILGLGYVDVVLVAFMSKRTEKGNRWLGQILGLKDFIQLAEKDRLEKLVNDNPSYFYDILPYAYVLNVSDKWIKKFEHINMEQPSWYHASTPMTNLVFLTAMTHNLNAMNASVNAIPHAESGSGGFTGGGGGFSGGGFGGGGGGSW